MSGPEPGRAAYEAYCAALSDTLDDTPYPFESLPKQLRAAWDAAIAAGAPRCPSGCGCRLGTEDADVRDCACAGLCCYDEIEVDGLFAERDALTGQLADVQRERDEARAVVAELRDVLLQGGQNAGDVRRQAFGVIERTGYATWGPHPVQAAPDLLAEMRERLEALAAGLKLSADTTYPSKKTEIERQCAAAVLAIARAGLELPAAVSGTEHQP